MFVNSMPVRFGNQPADNDIAVRTEQTAVNLRQLLDNKGYTRDQVSVLHSPKRGVMIGILPASSLTPEAVGRALTEVHGRKMQMVGKEGSGALNYRFNGIAIGVKREFQYDLE